MCWKLGGFSEDLTGEIENPLKIIDMINKSIVLDETKKLREYLYKLEEAYKNGDVSEIVYKKLKQEYESKLKEYLSVDNFR
jgi:transcriptional regulatory protein LevR